MKLSTFKIALRALLYSAAVILLVSCDRPQSRLGAEFP